MAVKMTCPSAVPSPPNARQFEYVAQIADAAVIQAAECSRLRDFLIFLGLKWLQQGRPNFAETALESMGDWLIPAFEAMIDNDDAEFFSSHIYKTGPHISDLDYGPHHDEPPNGGNDV
jgi:hypothetical protein